MFELKITSLNQAVSLSRKWATYTISLLDPGIEGYESIKIPVASHGQKLRRYYFNDITPSEIWNELSYDTENMKMVTSEQIQDILEFTTSLVSSDKLLVHCHAGISRSTAVACGVLCQHGLSPEEAIKHVLSVREQAFPNKYILKLFDEILGLENQLVVAHREIYRSKFGNF
ncbi:MAG: hypothetical protein DRQ41_09840 [Gammaproteobacteria bacterium]|nr:MAG: hypothetical protein DRQ41_09840 [Gammaproteobacteria bacterium]